MDIKELIKNEIAGVRVFVHEEKNNRCLSHDPSASIEIRMEPEPQRHAYENAEAPSWADSTFIYWRGVRREVTFRLLLALCAEFKGGNNGSKDKQ